jgi:purine-binding chemotaxis protein CheW
MGGLEQMKAYGEEGGGDIPQIPGAENEDTIPFLVCNVAEEMFAIDVSKVREVIRLPKMSWVPGAHESVLGVINLRGSIIAVLDLASLLGLRQDRDDGTNTRIIVIDSGNVTVGLQVDSVSEVIRLKQEELEQTMRTLDEGQRSVVVSQTTVKERIVGVLDIEQVVEGARDKQSIV